MHRANGTFAQKVSKYCNFRLTSDLLLNRIEWNRKFACSREKERERERQRREEHPRIPRRRREGATREWMRITILQLHYVTRTSLKCFWRIVRVCPAVSALVISTKRSRAPSFRSAHHPAPATFNLSLPDTAIPHACHEWQARGIKREE